MDFKFACGSQARQCHKRRHVALSVGKVAAWTQEVDLRPFKEPF